MRKQLTLALGLAVLATPAFATKARLQALGEDVYGSQYINDNRNIWLNAAQINNHKDLVTFEWGNTTAATDLGGSENAYSPRAEGGIYKSMGNLVYGVHFGGSSNTSNQFRQASGLTIADVQEENNIDVFVGGDSGVKWGANLGYSSSADDESNGDANQESLRTRLGVIAGDLQGYANINITNKAEDSAGNEFEGKLGYQVGAIYGWEGNNLFVDYRSFDGEGDIVAAGTKEDISLMVVEAGIGRVTRLNDKANLFTKASFVMAKAENDRSTNTFAPGTCGAAAALGCEEYSTTRIPVVVGLESEATSWLTLRASVGQAIWGKEEDKDDKRGIQASTFVAAGATLKFGELSLDGVIGNNVDGGATTSNTTAGGNGTIRSDVLMTRVGMTYRF